MPVSANPTTNYLPGGKAAREDNKVRPGDRAAHDWYRFVLSFPPHLVRDYLERLQIGPGKVVLDPFCGTGTTLVECKKLGIESVGVEPNPMAHFASEVKTDWGISAAGLLRDAREIAGLTLSRLESEGIDDVPKPPLFRTRSNGSPRLRARPELPTAPIPWRGRQNLEEVIRRGILNCRLRNADFRGSGFGVRELPFRLSAVD